MEGVLEHYSIDSLICVFVNTQSSVSAVASLGS